MEDVNLVRTGHVECSVDLLSPVAAMHKPSRNSPLGFLARSLVRARRHKWIDGRELYMYVAERLVLLNIMLYLLRFLVTPIQTATYRSEVPGRRLPCTAETGIRVLARAQLQDRTRP